MTGRSPVDKKDLGALLSRPHRGVTGQWQPHPRHMCPVRPNGHQLEPRESIEPHRPWYHDITMDSFVSKSADPVLAGFKTAPAFSRAGPSQTFSTRGDKWRSSFPKKAGRFSTSGWLVRQ